MEYCVNLQSLPSPHPRVLSPTSLFSSHAKIIPPRPGISAARPNKLKPGTGLEVVISENVNFVLPVWYISQTLRIKHGIGTSGPNDFTCASVTSRVFSL